MADKMKVLLAGTGVVLLLSMAGVLIGSREVENDLTDRVASVLSGDVSKWAIATMDGRAVTISGTAPSEDHLAITIERLESTPGVSRVISEAAGVLPLASPYAFTATYEAGVIRLEGHVPDDAVRAQVVEAARRSFRSGEVSDDLTIARGAPESGYELAVVTLLRVLSGLEEGQVELTDTMASLTGKAGPNTPASLASTALPVGYELSVHVEDPVQSPYVFQARRSEGEIALTGFVPDLAADNLIFSAARQAAGERVRVVNQLKIAAGAPADYEETASRATALLSYVSNGTVAINDATLALSGTARTPTDGVLLAAALERLDASSFKVEAGFLPASVAPYVFSISKNDKSVAISGFVTSQDLKTEVQNRLRANRPTLSGVVEVAVAAGAPAGFDQAVVLALDAMELLVSGSVTILDGTVTITGGSADQFGYMALDRLAAAVPDDFQVHNAVTPPMMTSWSWSLEKSGPDFSVKGFVADQMTRDAIMTSLREVVPAASLRDQMQPGLGAPADVDMAAFAVFAARQAIDLDEAVVTLVDGAAGIVGSTRDLDTAFLVRSGFSADLPPQIAVGRVDVSSPPAMRLTVSKADGAVEIAGTVTSIGAKAEILATAKSAFGSMPIHERLMVTDGLESETTDVARIAVLAASRLEQAVVRVIDRRVSVAGSTLHRAATSALRSYLTAELPDGYFLVADFGYRLASDVVAPEVCQAFAEDVLSQRPIAFGADGRIEATSFGTVDHLINTAFRCPQAMITITLPATDNADYDRARGSALSAAFAAGGVMPGRVAFETRNGSTTELAILFAGN